MARAGQAVILALFSGAVMLGLPAAARRWDHYPRPDRLRNVLVNGTGQTTLTFTNTSGADVTITGISVDDTTDYSLSAGSGTSCDSNPTIADQGTCDEAISFNPASTGPKSGTVTISFSDATTATASVTGTGVLPAVQIQSTSLSPAVFYPLVRDGFRDFTDYSFTLNK